MSVRDYSYYVAHEAHVKLDDIISPNKPAKDVILSKQTLQRLRDENLDSITVRGITVGQRYGYEFNDDTYFAFSEGDDLGWLGYFIGRSESLQKLIIENWSEDVIHALSDGIARNRSIKNVIVTELSSDDVFAAVARTLMNLTQLEELDVSRYKFGDAGITFLGRGLRSIGSSLKMLRLYNIGSKGLSTLAVALAECTSIKKLNLCGNDFSMAASGLRALSGWLQRAGIRLDELKLGGCTINDEGLNALIEGTMHDCKPLDLSTLQLLVLSHNNFGNDGLLTLAAALAGCTSIKKLDLRGNNFSMAAEGLRALSDSLQRVGIRLDELEFCGCHINDEGLSALTEGAMHDCKPLYLSSLAVLDLSFNNFGSEGLSALAAALDGLTSIKKLDLRGNNFSMAAEGLRALSGRLQRAGIQLDELCFDDCHINDEGLSALTEGAMHDCKPLYLSSLAVLVLSENNFGSEGLSALAAALAGCTSIKKLYLCENDFSMAASGLGALSESLQIAGIQLDELHLSDCQINDGGLQALIGGAVNHCEYLNLNRNGITAAGFRRLSTLLQGERCCMEKLSLGNMSIGDDTAELFARTLVGNKTLRNLILIEEDELEEDISITPAGWSAFSKALCDTSSVNNTYLSNHTIQKLWDDYADSEDIPQDLALYLRLNQRYPQHAANCKILMSHAHLDMAPFLGWELKFLPLAVDWFERAKPCTALSIDGDPILEESDEVFQSRVLTALYQFVREYPKKVLERRGEMTLVAAYDDKVALVELEKKRLRDEVEKRGREIDQRDKEIDRLDKENMRLRGIVESVKKTVDSY